MSRAWIHAALVCGALFGSVTAAGACSDDGSGGAGGGDPCADELDADKCFDYSCVETEPGDVSFKTDILPVFENSCALSSSCHGNDGGLTPAADRPYLGSIDQMTTPSDVAAIRAAIIGQTAVQSSMLLVDPSHPETSFLMHKMDGDIECASLDCVGGDCGTAMPQSSDILPRETRDLVRAWISQGALDN
ncbi:MAG: hypothetical protein U0271_18020 [Polyangiaceae bacterium]